MTLRELLENLDRSPDPALQGAVERGLSLVRQEGSTDEAWQLYAELLRDSAKRLAAAASWPSHWHVLWRLSQVPAALAERLRPLVVEVYADWVYFGSLRPAQSRVEEGFDRLLTLKLDLEDPAQRAAAARAMMGFVRYCAGSYQGRARLPELFEHFDELVRAKPSDTRVAEARGSAWESVRAAARHEPGDPAWARLPGLVDAGP